MNRFIWLIRREFWENRAVWMLPAAVGAFLLLTALFGAVRFDFAPSGMPVPMDMDGGGPGSRAISGMFLLSVSGIFIVLMSIYSTWYLLDCLYAERKDRSILFWKSLPVSDTETVLAKLATALIAIPLVYFAFADAASLLAGFVLSLRRGSTFTQGLWHADLWLQLQALWLYVIVTLAIWLLPVAGWIMLVSAWVRSAVILWSILPPLAVIMAERILLRTHWFADWLRQRLLDGYFSTAFHGAPQLAQGAPSVAPDFPLWRLLDPQRFFTSAATWIGVAAGALLILGAIQARLRRAEL